MDTRPPRPRRKIAPRRRRPRERPAVRHRVHDRTALVHPLDDILPGEARVLEAAEESLAGRRRGLRRAWPFLGPGFIASVAYIDPGNFATNMASGAGYGYLLLWVVLMANLMAMLIQAMSAKLGVATGRNLPELCRERFNKSVTVLLWIQAEVIAVATDLAELIGAAIGLGLLFGVSLFPAALLTGAASFGILALQAKGFRRVEAVIAMLIGVMVAAFALQVVMAKPSASGIAHGLLPGFDGRESVLLAVGIVGATVMPHVIYLHSALTQHRIVGATEEAKRHIFRFELADVVVAMGTAGAINMSMLITAAAVFHSRSDRGGQPPDGRPRRAWHLPRKRRRPALWLWGAKTRSCVRAGALGLSEPIAWLALSIMGGVGAGIVAVRDVGAGDDARVAVLSLVGLQGA